MAGPPGHRASPASSRRPGDPTLGAAPRDGDFARLLEAESAPDAHRMAVDPALESFGAPESRRARRARRIPYGPPGMVRDHATHADAAARSSGVTPARVRGLRDRVVMVLFAVAGLFVLMSVVDAARRDDNDVGALLVLAIVAFLVVRAWSRARRRPPGSG